MFLSNRNKSTNIHLSVEFLEKKEFYIDIKIIKVIDYTAATK